MIHTDKYSMATISELEKFKMSDAVKFHKELNPNLWMNHQLDPEVKDQLMVIAEDFISTLGISDLDVIDVTISGSNAAYSYTPHSDLDLHIIVDMSKLRDDAIYRELFNAKKTLYNDSHDITVHGVPVELYVQDANEPVKSLGEYSVLDDKWIRIPKKSRANFDQAATKAKFDNLAAIVELALKTKDLARVEKTIDTVKRYRTAGLEKGGEFGPENLAFKAIRSQGGIQSLYDLRNQLRSEKLSIEEEAKLLDKPEMTVAELAAKHKVPRMVIAKQLDKGIKVELEHTSHRGVAREIALDHLAEDPRYYDKLDKAKLEESIAPRLEFTKPKLDYQMLQEAVEDYYKKDGKWFPHRTHGIHQLISRSELRESAQDDVKEFWNQLIRLDGRNKVKLVPGNLVSVIQCWTHVYDHVFELRGNLNPKEIIDVVYEDDKINYVQFSDGSTFPDKSFLDRGQGGELDGIVTTFFPSKSSAEHMLTMLNLVVPAGWKLSTANLNESLNETEGQLNETTEESQLINLIAKKAASTIFKMVRKKESQLANIIAPDMKRHKLQTWGISAENLGVPYTNDPVLSKILDHTKFRVVDYVSPTNRGTMATYDSVTHDITVYYPALKKEADRLKYQTESYLAKTIAHEIQHAVDNLKSSGRAFTSNKKAYATKPYEINARFQEALMNITLGIDEAKKDGVPINKAQLGAFIDQALAHNYIAQFLPKDGKRYRQLVKRAYKFFEAEMNNPKREQPLNIVKRAMNWILEKPTGTVNEAVNPLLKTFKNPSPKALYNLTSRSAHKRMRGMYHEGDTYWWDANDAIHKEGADSLGIPYDYLNRLESGIDSISGNYRVGGDDGVPHQIIQRYDIENEILDEIGFSNMIGPFQMPDDQIVSNSTKDGTIGSRPVFVYVSGPNRIYFFANESKIDAFVYLHNGYLKGMKNLAANKGLVYNLFQYIINMKGQEIHLGPTDQLTQDGIKWLLGQTNRGTGFTLHDQSGNPIDPAVLFKEWEAARETFTPGPTAITISESKNANRVRENENLLMPMDTYGATLQELDPTKHTIIEIPELFEASGYIPSAKEKNDPRFKTALTVDVKPNSIKDNAAKLGLGNIKRNGIPQTANPNGKPRTK